jgi:hypothetical protein
MIAVNNIGTTFCRRKNVSVILYDRAGSQVPDSEQLKSGGLYN